MSTRRWLLSVALILTFACFARLGARQPDAVERRRIDAVFSAYDRTDSPGCALAIYRDGDIIYERGYGMASLEHRAAITPETVFDIGSTSKQFTAFSILLLERQGKLSLDDEIQKFLPEIPKYERPITVRHLMQHTSGLRDYLTLWSLAGVKTESWTTQKEAVELVTRQKHANFAAGDDWLYSNTGYLLLAEIVARAGGAGLRDFARDQIFRPLGMRQTFYLDDHTLVVPHRATGYSPRDGGGFQVEMSDFEQIGDGGVQTTVEDLLMWDRNFYAPKVGNAALLDRAQAVGTLNGGRVIDYAAGLTIGQYRGLRTVRHGGSWAGYRAELLRLPEQKTSIACLCNLASANPSRLANQVADIVLEKWLKPVEASKQPAVTAASHEVALSAEQLTGLAGVYLNTADAADYRRLAIRDGRLAMPPGAALTPIAADRFQMRNGAELAFSTRQGRREMQVLPAPGSTAQPLVFLQLPAFALDDATEYAGKYYSDELDATYAFAARDGKLVLQAKGRADASLMAVERDVFLHDDGLVIRFDRSAGKVTGVTVNAGRVRNLVFLRQNPAAPDVTAALQRVCGMQQDLKDLHPAFERVYPIAVVTGGTFFVYEPDPVARTYKLVATSPDKMNIPKGVRAAMPLDFWNNRFAVVVTPDAFDDERGLVMLFHEFVHCYQWDSGELRLKQQTTVYRTAMERKDYMWELQYAFPYTADAFQKAYSGMLDALGKGDTERVAAIRAQMKKDLTPEQWDYMTWQEWKEGLARYLENAVNARLRRPANKGGLTPPFSRVTFYAGGEAVIRAITAGQPALLRDIERLYHDVAQR